MAIPDGKPATDFSAMNREWVRAVAEEAAGSGGGIPAPENPSDGDVLTYDSTDDEWVAAAPGGGESDILVVTITEEESGDDYIYTFSPSIDDIVAAKDAGKLVMGMYIGGQATTDVNCYKNADDDWGITVLFSSFSVEVSGIHLFIDTYTQTNSDASMTYDSAEGIVTTT